MDEPMSAQSATPAPATEAPREVLSGRMWTVLICITLAWFLPFWEKLDGVVQPPGPRKVYPEKWAVGGKARVPLTVITSDYNNLGCASATVIDGARCAHSADQRFQLPEPTAPLDDNKANIIQPYSTYPDNHVVMVAGLWAQPVVASRLHNEPPNGKPDNTLMRFTVTCDLSFVGKLTDFSVRWRPSDNWYRPQPALVARPSNCVIGDD
jgi:hypothetical protein